MPRLARLDAPDILHHVIIRGLERRRIFRDEKDQDDFLGRLGDFISETGTSCYACGNNGDIYDFMRFCGHATAVNLLSFRDGARRTE